MAEPTAPELPQAPKPIRLSRYAQRQCLERGATHPEVEAAIRHGARDPVREDRWMYRYNVEFNGIWQGNPYAIRQVAPVVAEEPEEIIESVLTGEPFPQVRPLRLSPQLRVQCAVAWPQSRAWLYVLRQASDRARLGEGQSAVQGPRPGN